MSLSSPKKRFSRHFSLSEKESVINIYKAYDQEHPELCITDIVEFTAKVAGIALASVYRILREYKRNNHVLQPPKVYHRRRAILDNLDDNTKSRIRQIVDSFLLRNETPTISKVLIAVNENEALPTFKKSTLYKLLNELGFRSSTLDNNTCSICKKKFSRASEKNRHIKEIHKTDLPSTASNKKTNIICSICNTVVVTHEKLKTHLLEVHDLSCEEERLAFINKQSFEDWRALDKRNVNYIFEYSKANRDNTTVRYICNRSNLRGFKSNCKKRTMKTGGSIKISGTCPSRITAQIFPDDTVHVQYVKTHVGHKNELRTQRLSKTKMIIKSHNEAEKPENIVQLVETGKFEVDSATVLGCNDNEVEDTSSEELRMVDATNTEIYLKQELPAFMCETSSYENFDSINGRRKIKMEEIINGLNCLDDQTFEKTADEVLSLIAVNKEEWVDRFIKLES